MQAPSDKECREIADLQASLQFDDPINIQFTSVCTRYYKLIDAYTGELRDLKHGYFKCMRALAKSNNLSQSKMLSLIESWLRGLFLQVRITRSAN